MTHSPDLCFFPEIVEQGSRSTAASGSTPRMRGSTVDTAVSSLRTFCRGTGRVRRHEAPAMAARPIQRTCSQTCSPMFAKANGSRCLCLPFAPFRGSTVIRPSGLDCEARFPLIRTSEFLEPPLSAVKRLPARATARAPPAHSRET